MLRKVYTVKGGASRWREKTSEVLPDWLAKLAGRLDGLSADA